MRDEPLRRALRNVQFAHAAARAVEGGVVAQHEATRWLDEFQDAHRDDRFFCTTLTFRAAAQKE